MARSEKKSRDWLVTYSDLITLLLVFFVLLYMLTPGIDQSRFDSFISYFQRSIGVMEQTSVLAQELSRRELAEQRIMEQWQVMQQFLESAELEAHVDLEQTEDGVKITLRDDLTFESGSSELLPPARSVLEVVASLLTGEVGRIEVEGHTDDVPISAASRYRTNWHLGAARAVSVVLFLQERSAPAPEQYQAVSFGEYRPVAPNTAGQGRARNRRVEIYVRYTELMELAELPHESNGR